MSEVINFVVAHWETILNVIVLIVSVVVFIVKKKPVKVVDTIKQSLASWIPGVVVAAEGSGLKGEAKLNYAIDMLYNLFASDYLTRDEFDNKYLSFVKNQIEAVLATPQKKGDLYGER